MIEPIFQYPPIPHPPQKNIDNDIGTKNNLVSVRKSDFEVFEALAKDSEDAINSAQKEYSQVIPTANPWEKVTGPPVLPPHLLQVILNKDTPLSVSSVLIITNLLAMFNAFNICVFSASRHCCRSRIMSCSTICTHCPSKTVSWCWAQRIAIGKNTSPHCCTSQSKTIWFCDPRHFLGNRNRTSCGSSIEVKLSAKQIFRAPPFTRQSQTQNIHTLNRNRAYAGNTVSLLGPPVTTYCRWIGKYF